MFSIRRSLYLKITAILLTALFILQPGAVFSLTRDETLATQFNKAKEEYTKNNFPAAVDRLQRLAAFYENIFGNLDEQKKNGCGHTLLLLGVCFEKQGMQAQAESSYIEAKKILGKNFSIPGIKLKKLEIYAKIKKMKMPSTTSGESNVQKSDAKSEGNVIPVEKNGAKKKKKISPWLIAGAAIAAAAVVYFVLMKKPKRTLNVTVGEGISGSPGSGTSTYKKGAAVTYNYSLQGGYANLVVKLDGNVVSNSGEFKMYSNHTLTVSATKQYTLTVTKGIGVDGTPVTGEHKYNPGETVNYNYSLQNGYKNLAVLIDGVGASAGGSITMDRDHTLTASATQKVYYTLTVNRGAGVNGSPSTGTYSYLEGTILTCNYTLQTGYKNLVVTLNGATVSSNGSFTMDKARTLSATASKIGTITNVSLKITVTFAGANLQFTHKVEVDGISQLRTKYAYEAHYTTQWSQAAKHTATINVIKGLGDMKIKQIAYTDVVKIYPAENLNLWETIYKLEITGYDFTGGVDPGKPILSKNEFNLKVGPWNNLNGWVTEKTETITLSAPSN